MLEWVMKVKLSGNFGLGKYVLVDKEDFDRVRQYTWWLGTKNLRPATDIWDKTTKKSKRVLLSRFILNPVKGMVVDHINGDPLDNRRANLRVCSFKENQRNRTVLNKNNTSGFRGVSWDRFRNMWVAQLSFNRKHIYLGRYKDKKDARKAVKMAILKRHGDYANINNV